METKTVSLSLYIHTTHNNGLLIFFPSLDGFPTLTFGEPISSESQVTLLQLIAYMDAHTAQEGLFRKPGSKTRVESLVRELGERSLEDIVASNTYSAHDFASVLKQFFSDLPEPLMLQRHLDAYIQAAGI